VFFRPGAHKPWQYQWTTLTAEASMFHFQSIFFSKTFCGKNAEAAENLHIFQLLSVFQCSITHSRLQREAHQAIAIKAGVLLCACVQFQYVLIYKIL
jgi:hypothetical protein